MPAMRTLPPLAAAVVALAALPAAAIDCDKAKTDPEKAICADPALIAVDEAMQEAFAALRRDLSRDERDGLRQSQRGWLDRRDAVCAGRDGQVDTGCIASMTLARTGFLAGRPLAGNEAMAFPPRFFAIEERGRRFRYEVTIAYPQMAESGATARAFDKAAEAFALSGRGEHWEDDPPEPTRDELPAEGRAETTYERDYVVTFASAKLISVEFSTFAFTAGAAHPWSETDTLNWDVDRGRPLEVGDVLSPEGVGGLTTLCLDQLTQERRRRGVDGGASDMLTAETVRQSIENTGKWSITGDGMNVIYDEGIIGARAEGAYACLVPHNVLRKAALPDSLLPVERRAAQ
jgi:uncharacterized protein YecT (DUF1311 family)